MRGRKEKASNLVTGRKHITIAKKKAIYGGFQ